MGGRRRRRRLTTSKAAGVTIISDVDKQPFIDATQSVRDQYGAKYADLLKAINAAQ